MSKLCGPSFFLGSGLVAAILGIAVVLFARSRGALPGSAPAERESGERTERASPPADLPAPEASARRQAAEGGELLSLDDLRALLLSPRRLDQVRAIELLLARGTPEALQVLLDAFLASSDPLLVGLLEEAMLKSTTDLAPSLIAAFRASRDPERLTRIGRTLARLAGERPDVEKAVVGLLVGMLRDPDLKPEHLAALEDALVALGGRALETLAAYLSDPAAGPEGAGTVAAILSRLDAAHGSAVREKVREGFEAMRRALEDPALTATEKDATRKKTGSLAWAVGNRPASEHDLLSRDLVDGLLRTTDPAQAGTLAWGLTNLKGLSDEARFETVQSILGALPGQSGDALRQSYVWAASQIVAAGYGNRALDEGFYRMMQAAEEASGQHANDPRVSASLRWLLAELKTYEKKKLGG